MGSPRTILLALAAILVIGLIAFFALRDTTPSGVGPGGDGDAPGVTRIDEAPRSTSSGPAPVGTIPPSTSSNSASVPAAAGTATATASDSERARRLIEDPRFTRLPGGGSEYVESVKMAESLGDKEADGFADLEIVEAIFGAYLWAFKELPEGGENAEIIAGLTGKNPKQLILIPPDHPALDTDGNLLDRWGTPYYFHKQSDSELGIRSAGPDRRLWSGDDLIHNEEASP